MSTRHTPTPAVEQALVAYIRAGGFPHIAAEAAGVPREVFADWMRRGEQPGARGRYRDFALAVHQAAAHARLGAEVSVRTDKPLDWLRNGPGRESADSPGWTGNARARSSQVAQSPLLDPEVQALFAGMLEAVGDHPEVRDRIAALLQHGLDSPGEYCTIEQV